MLAGKMFLLKTHMKVIFFLKFKLFSKVIPCLTYMQNPRKNKNKTHTQKPSSYTTEQKEQIGGCQKWVGGRNEESQKVQTSRYKISHGDIR